MEKLQGFDFQALNFDRKGIALGGLDGLAAHVGSQNVTDVIVICHGFRNDEDDARRLYSDFLKTFGANMKNPLVASQLGGRQYAVGGVFWPSMVFSEPNPEEGSALSVGGNPDKDRLEKLKEGLDAGGRARIDSMIDALDAARGDDTAAQDSMIEQLLLLLNERPECAGEEFQALLKRGTPDALRKSFAAGDEIVVSSSPGGGAVIGIPTLDVQPTGEGGAQSFFGKVFGFVPKFLNLTTFLLMFERSGVVGEKGISLAVRKVRAAKPAVRVHLVGHSLGGRAVTACAKSLTEPPAVQVNSMMLLQAAYSHFGLSKGGVTAGGIDHPRGFFRDVIEKQAVKAPLVATHSQHDSVVGFAYTSMAAVSLNNAKAIGDENSPFGGIGRNGVLDTDEAQKLELHEAGQAYQFQTGIYNLDGSRKVGDKFMIESHGDIKNQHVTWAFASLLATT